MNSVRSTNKFEILKVYTSGYKDLEIRKLEFVAKAQLLCQCALIVMLAQKSRTFFLVFFLNSLADNIWT